MWRAAGWTAPWQVSFVNNNFIAAKANGETVTAGKISYEAVDVLQQSNLRVV